MLMSSVGRNLDRTNLEMVCLSFTMPVDLTKKTQMTGSSSKRGDQNHWEGFFHHIWHLIWDDSKFGIS